MSCIDVRYPAPGDPALARRVQSLLAPAAVGRDDDWGLDHGTWSVLCHVFPDADVPVVQLSMDETQPAAFHYELGKRLAPLRDEGVLVMGSGNLVHNLHAYGWGRRSLGPSTGRSVSRTGRAWLIRDGEDGPLIAYESLGADARLSVPTPEHYLPLLYVLGAARARRGRAVPRGGLRRRVGLDDGGPNRVGSRPRLSRRAHSAACSPPPPGARRRP